MDINVGDMVKLKPAKIVSALAPGIYKFSLPSDIGKDYNLTGLCETDDIESVVERPLKIGEVVRIKDVDDNFTYRIVAIDKNHAWLRRDSEENKGIIAYIPHLTRA